MCHCRGFRVNRIPSLRVAVLVFFVTFFPVAFVFLFFLLRLLSKEDIGSN